MRIKLTLQPFDKESSIPLNYQYYLSSAIYRIIEQSSTEYATQLHNAANLNFGKSFKHFCFSQLYPQHSFVKDGAIHLNGDRIIWYVGMSIDDTLKHFIVGLFEKREFFIGNDRNRFMVQFVELLPEPKYTQRMNFRMLSPVTASIPVKNFGKLQARYLFADDPQLSDILRSNILERYKALYHRLPENQSFFVKPDAEYIDKRGGAQKVSKLITIKEGTEAETRVRGFLCPLTIEGNPELIKLAYDSGLGEKGSMGFGMLEVA